MVVVALRVERLDEIRHAGLAEGLAKARPRFDEATRELRIPLGVDRARQAEAVDVVTQADAAQEVDQNSIEMVLVLGPGQSVVDPRVVNALDRIARPHGLGEPAGRLAIPAGVARD